MDYTKQEAVVNLVQKLQRQYKNNSKISIDYSPPVQQHCVVDDDVGYFYTYAVSGKFDDWIIRVIEKDLLINPLKKYYLFIKPVVVRDGVVHVRLAKLLLEKKKIERKKRSPRSISKPAKKR